MIGITAVLRHQWVGAEQVPFPQTMVAHELARGVEPGFGAHPKSTEFLVGMILGGAFVILIFMMINYTCALP